MLIYVSGPMTGIKDFNRATFARARRVLEHRWPNAGVFVPHDSFGGRQDLALEVYMQLDLAIVRACDMIAILPGWEDSAGAVAEVTIARELGIPRYFMKL